MIVHEGGLKFWVNLSDYVDTGLFLDHRVARKRVMDEADGKRMLNLFAYTGAFSVYAAGGGARSTTTVDLSRTYLDWAGDNFEANGLSGRQHKFIASDAVEFLDEAQRRGDQYDLVVFDPPTYSNSKRTDSDWDVQVGYLEVFRRLSAIVASEGVVYFSTNFRRFKFDDQAVRKCGFASREISTQTVPEDFRNRRIHRCWRLTKLGES
jgi:23S rRNA (guanine2445-N2)-methyltransferase / 23S rRNA (guanine2069-N7)-methyltransferase